MNLVLWKKIYEDTTGGFKELKKKLVSEIVESLCLDLYETSCKCVCNWLVWQRL